MTQNKAEALAALERVIELAKSQAGQFSTFTRYKANEQDCLDLRAFINAQDGWEPIESAPRDGTEILAWHIQGKNWHQVQWIPSNWAMRWNNEYCQYDADFSHWMPLPNAPASPSENEANSLGSSAEKGGE